MQKKLILLAAITLTLSASSLLFAHEFWLMPNKFKVKVNELMTLTFYVGEDFMGEIWGKRIERTLKVTDFVGKKQTDLTTLAIQSDSNDIKLSFDKAGTDRKSVV